MSFMPLVTLKVAFPAHVSGRVTTDVVIDEAAAPPPPVARLDAEALRRGQWDFSLGVVS